MPAGWELTGPRGAAVLGNSPGQQHQGHSTGVLEGWEDHHSNCKASSKNQQYNVRETVGQEQTWAQAEGAAGPGELECPVLPAPAQGPAAPAPRGTCSRAPPPSRRKEGCRQR